MLRELSKPISYAQRTIDMILVFIAWMLAYYVRFNYVPNASGDDLQYFATLGLILVVLSLYIFNRSDLYSPQRYLAWYREFLTVFVNNVQVTVVFIFLLYMLAPGRVSRLTIAFDLVFVEVLHIGFRIVTRRRLNRNRARGKNLRYALLIGNGPQNITYVDKVNSLPQSGIRFAGWVESQGAAADYGIPEVDRPVAAAIEEVDPDMIVVGYPGNDPRRFDRVLIELYKQTRPVFVLPHLQHIYLRNEIDDFNGIAVMQINRPRIRAVDLVVKRILDIVASLLGLLVLSPVLMLIALAVKLTSRGPIFYGQERVTLNGATFKMWKFRSMRVDAEKESGARWAQKDDPRRTPIGTFLRSTSLDELPQLWNILTGSMSLVGPRPERPVFVDKFKHEIPGYMLRHTMKAGLTGWAQANGWRGDTSLEKRIEFDIYYIKNWSLALDFEIVLLTIIRGFVNKNAY